MAGWPACLPACASASLRACLPACLPACASASLRAHLPACPPASPELKLLCLLCSSVLGRQLIWPGKWDASASVASPACPP